MKTILITGTTGMIGELILHQAINDENIEKIISISRKPLLINDPKLIEVIHDDYLDYSNIKKHFSNIDIVYFCIGVYTGAVSIELFRKITVEYTRAFADILKEESPKASLVFLSGMGADRSEKSSMMFAQDKGIAENYLLSKKFKELYIFRPGYIYPVTPRVEPNFSYKLYRFLYPLIKTLMPNSAVTSEHLAKSMFKVGKEGLKLNTLENKDILKIDI